MDEASESVLDKLQQLLRPPQGFLTEVWEKEEDQRESMENNLGVVKAFLRDSSIKSYYSKSYQEFVIHICNCLSDIDDIIDDCEMQFATFSIPNSFDRSNLRLLSQKLDSLCDQIQTSNTVSGDFSTPNVQRRPSLQEPPPISESNPVMGLEEETKTVIGYLTEETEKLDVIPIVGMPGIGKTTLAWKAFTSDEAKDGFPTRIWINVSNEFVEREVFLAILKGYISLTDNEIDDLDPIDDYDLAIHVARYIENEKFLIVMDDVCSAYDWDRLQIALPQSSKKGKVLITSCNENVSGHANRTRLPLKVGLLTPDESWSLLRSKVFVDHQCPAELEYIGQVIVDQCCGLPLAITGMARTLLEADLSSSDMKERRIAWTKVSSRVPQIFYRSLPNHTRLCFLYFGMFPEGFDIPVWKLISMWIAEGFIQKRGNMSLEETAETYLEDLISRNLVITGRIKSSGEAKTCCIHPMLHEFCRIEAGNLRKNFLQEIELSDGDFHPPISDLSTYHRLSISSNFILNFLSSKPVGPRVRSFVCFSADNNLPKLTQERDKKTLPEKYSSVIPAGFKRLRVLDVMPTKLTNISSDMYELVHLKFLALSFFGLRILPAEISKLCNLQTLIIDTTSRTLEIRASIWQFTQLKHLKTNASATLTGGDYSKPVKNLQTLTMVSPESCTKALFATVPNLKKFGIRGILSSLFCKLSSLSGLPSDLENLKLVNDVYPLSASSGRLHSLWSSDIFPPRLRSLTLAQTRLDWSQMYYLGRLKRLEVLKLKDHAFIGLNWVTEDGGFRNLQVLHIGYTDLVIWEASAHHFPRLTTVKLHYCKDLKEIPIQLADIPSLRCLELRLSHDAAASAIRIHDKIKNNRCQEGPSRNDREFNLSMG